MDNRDPKQSVDEVASQPQETETADKAAPFFTRLVDRPLKVRTNVKAGAMKRCADYG